MCITNPSKISDFRENLLHMLLFWTLILFDSYAYSYKTRGCRMCNSPFFASHIFSCGEKTVLPSNRCCRVPSIWRRHSIREGEHAALSVQDAVRDADLADVVQSRSQRDDILLLVCDEVLSGVH